MQLALFTDSMPEDLAFSHEKLAKLKEAKIIGFDIETSNNLSNVSDEYARAYFAASGKLGLSFVSNLLYIGLWSQTLPTGMAITGEDMEHPEIRSAIVALFSGYTGVFAAHNSVFDLRLLAGKYRIPIPKKLWDTFTNELIRGDVDPGHRMQGGRSISLFGLVDYYNIDTKYNVLSHPLLLRLAEQMRVEPVDAFAAMKKKRDILDDTPQEMAAIYAIVDPMYTVLVAQEQLEYFKRIEKEYPHLWEILSFEGRFNRACADMCATGMTINKTYLLELMHKWDVEMRQCEKEMLNACLEYCQSGVLANYQTLLNESAPISAEEKHFRMNGFNPNSLKDQSFYIQKVLGISPPPKTKATEYLYTSTGKVSFGKAAIDYYEARYPGRLATFIQYRNLEKKIQKAQELLAHSAFDGKVHALTTTATVTGRTASSQPNLQNMKMYPDRGTKALNFQGVVTAPPGRILIGLDISNAETYMGAMMAQDNIQMEALYAGDFHSQMAAIYFPVLWKRALEMEEQGDNEFRVALRKASKAITFGTAYGMGAVKLARNPDMDAALNVTDSELEELQEDKDFVSWAVFRGLLPDTVYTYQDKEVFEGVRDGETVYQINGIPVGIDTTQATLEEWHFAAKCWNAQAILQQKEASFPKTTLAKQAAEAFAERCGYVEMWTGRRINIRESRKAWNAICQGGVGELAKRWAVLIYEQLEDLRSKYPLLDAKIVNFVHDEIVIDTAVECAEVVAKIAISCMSRVLDTQPFDKSGRLWSERTTPPCRFIAGIDHADNAHKWGLQPYGTYPFDTHTSWEEATQEEIQKILSSFDTPEYIYSTILSRRYAAETEGGFLGQQGLTFREYITHLIYLINTYADIQAQYKLDYFDELLVSLQKTMGLPMDGYDCVFVED